MRSLEIPGSAGEPVPGRIVDTQLAVYPRECGENVIWPVCSTLPVTSPGYRAPLHAWWRDTMEGLNIGEC